MLKPKKKTKIPNLQYKLDILNIIRKFLDAKIYYPNSVKTERTPIPQRRMARARPSVAIKFLIKIKLNIFKV
jgi:hypothetical protein